MFKQQITIYETLKMVWIDQLFRPFLIQRPSHHFSKFLHKLRSVLGIENSYGKFGSAWQFFAPYLI